MDESDRKILAALNTDDPVRLYYACKEIVHSHSRSVALRLIEILDDPCDWDCGHYPAREAMAALGRIDPTGWCWMEAAGRAFHRHVDGNPDLATALFDAVRQAMPVSEFLMWANQVAPEPHRVDEPWVITILDWTGVGWVHDDRFIDELLAHLTEADRLAVISELLFFAEVHWRCVRGSPLEASHADEADRLRRWTKDAPAHIREAVKTRLKFMDEPVTPEAPDGNGQPCPMSAKCLPRHRQK